jgi:hypothetical protein
MMSFAAMSNRAGQSGTVAGSSLLEKRLLLLSSSDILGVHDQFEWAEMCLSAGLRDAARLLYEGAFLRRGFSPQLLMEQARFGAETGLWPPEPEVESASTANAGTVEIAMAEMRGLAKALSSQFARGPAEPQHRDAAASAPPTGAVVDHISIDGVSGEVEATVHALFLAFRRRTVPGCVADVGAAVESLWNTSRRGPEIDHRFIGAASLPRLGAGLGLVGVREFLYANRDLVWGAYGSAELLHRAGRLNSFGLGPWFSNAQHIVRRSRDVFELAYVASDVADEEGVGIGVEPWIGLLSRRLGGPLLAEVIDDLGDLNAKVALSMIYDRAASLPLPRIDTGLIMRLRDAALDNLDYDLASRAQALIVRLRPDVLHERVILGDIYGSAGRVAEAKQSFLICLKQSPGNEAITGRLAALNLSRFTPFEVRRGFVTPEDRRVRRLQRRASVDIQ